GGGMVRGSQKICASDHTTDVVLVDGDGSRFSSPRCYGRHNHGTRAIAATTIRTGSRSGSPATSNVSPGPSAARCAAELQSNPSSAHLKDDHRMGRNHLNLNKAIRLRASPRSAHWRR